MPVKKSMKLMSVKITYQEKFDFTYFAQSAGRIGHDSLLVDGRGFLSGGQPW